MDNYIASAKHSNEYFKFLNNQPVKKYNNWDEYFVDLNEWFNQQIYIWNLTAKFPYFLAQQQVSHRARNQTTTTQNEIYVAGERTTPTPRVLNEGIECQVPHLWKRVVAEFIDFLILFFFKLAVTFIAVNFYDLVDWDKFDDLLILNSKLEYKAVLKMTHGIVLLELVHRIVVVAFETYWLTSGGQGKIGGATPGKAIMGLRVVRCDTTEDLPRPPTVDPNFQQTFILVKPGIDLGFQASFLRALVKNIVLTLFIPASFALLYFRHNRTCYDMMCNSVVVEEPILRHNRPHQQ